MKFSWNCEFQLKLWISVQIVKFSRNCEGQSRFNQFLLELDWWEIGKISSRKYSFIKRTNPSSENGLQPKWGLPGGNVWSSSRETINLGEFFLQTSFLETRRKSIYPILSLSQCNFFPQPAIVFQFPAF